MNISPTLSRASQGPSSEESPESPPQIYFDCTATFRNGGNTGIQRVVRNLILNGPAAGAELGLTCTPVAHCFGEWYCIESLPRQEVRAEAERHGWRRVATSVRDALLWFRKRLRKALVPRWLFHFWTNLYNWVAWRMAHRRAELRPNDILLLPDVGWGPVERLPLAQAKRNGVRLGLLSYDLIPLLFPRFWWPGFPDEFERWLRATLEQADFCVAISQAVQRDLCEFIEHEGGRYERLKNRVGWFPLGVSLDMASPTAEIRCAVRDVFDRPETPPTFLTVCTLEPRKNHATLLDAFDRLRQRCPQAQLCLVGRPGWLCDDLIARITAHPAYGRQLHWFSDLSDTELDHCYRHASTFVFPSFSEGFGLPVVEALRYGLTVLASDVPAHREIGDGFCHFFDPHSPEQLADMMRACVGEGALGSVRPSTEFQPTDWREASLALWRECQRLARKVSQDGQLAADATRLGASPKAA